MGEARRLTALVVEPDKGARDQILPVLQSLGFSTLEILDPLEALQTAKRLSFDLLVVAALYPGGLARQFARKMGLINPRMRILFSSTYPLELLVQGNVLSAGSDVL